MTIKNMNDTTIKLFSIEKINTYKKLCNNNSKKALTLYDWNVKLSESLYTPLNYFEIILRNACNEELTKEFGKLWYLNSKIMLGSNPKKGGYANEKISKSYKKLTGNGKKYKKGTNILSIKQCDIISNLELGFWINLFVYNYFNQLWNPCLKYIFTPYNRKELWKALDEIRYLRNRIFHHENIIKQEIDLEKIYNNILEIIEIISPKLKQKLASLNSFQNTYYQYLEFKNEATKNSGAPLNQPKDSLA